MSRGHEVVGIGIESEPFEKCSKYISMDATNSAEVSSLDLTSDYIFAFAGLTGTHAGFDQYDKFLKLNDVILLNILNSARKTGNSGRVVFPSTRLVYKGVKDKFLSEGAEKEAKTVYAQNKLSCEAYLGMYANSFGIDFTVFRICVPYGNSLGAEYSYGTVGFFLNKASSGKNITLYGDGSQRRTFTHVSDLTNLIILGLGNHDSINQVYNIGSNDALSLFDAASIIAKNFGVDVEFTQWPEEDLRLESGDTILDDKKILNLSHYIYEHSFENWVKTLS